ncbi:hypothetical protein KI387_023422, partial [Taxus chinensis]
GEDPVVVHPIFAQSPRHVTATWASKNTTNGCSTKFLTSNIAPPPHCHLSATWTIRVCGDVKKVGFFAWDQVLSTRRASCCPGYRHALNAHPPAVNARGLVYGPCHRQIAPWDFMGNGDGARSVWFLACSVAELERPFRGILQTGG